METTVKTDLLLTQKIADSICYQSNDNHGLYFNPITTGFQMAKPDRATHLKSEGWREVMTPQQFLGVVKGKITNGLSEARTIASYFVEQDY